MVMGLRRLSPQKGYTHTKPTAPSRPKTLPPLTPYLPGNGTTGKLSFPVSETDWTPKK
jgi:hypothetical protein